MPQHIPRAKPGVDPELECHSYLLNEFRNGLYLQTGSFQAVMMPGLYLQDFGCFQMILFLSCACTSQFRIACLPGCCENR